MTVTAVDPDATTAVTAVNYGTVPWPPPGQQFFTVSLRVTNNATGPQTLKSWTLFNGRTSQGRTFHGNECGPAWPVPADFGNQYLTIAPRASVEATAICWKVSSAEADGLVMFTHASSAVRPVWFALTPTVAPTEAPAVQDVPVSDGQLDRVTWMPSAVSSLAAVNMTVVAVDMAHYGSGEIVVTLTSAGSRVTQAACTNGSNPVPLPGSYRVCTYHGLTIRVIVGKSIRIDGESEPLGRGPSYLLPFANVGERLLFVDMGLTAIGSTTAADAAFNARAARLVEAQLGQAVDRSGATALFRASDTEMCTSVPCFPPGY